MSGFRPEWRTAHRVEDVGAFPDVNGLFEPERELRHEIEEYRRGWDGPCPCTDDRSGANDVRLCVTLFRSAQKPRQQQCARLSTAHTNSQEGRTVRPLAHATSAE
jgi:hypothetical protein